MWTEKLSNVVLDHGCTRYAVCELYVHTHARTHAQTKFSIEHTSVGLAHARPSTSFAIALRSSFIPLSYFSQNMSEGTPLHS